MHKVTNDRQEWYVSELLEEQSVAHGFFTRRGGASPAPYVSLNMRTLGEDSAENVLENKQRALKALNLPINQLRFARKLAHGRNAVINAPVGVYDDIDVLIATDKQPLGLSVADCVPVIVAQRDPDIVALIHAGWRGTVQRVSERTVGYLVKEFGLDLQKAVAAIGPAIGVDSYEVEKEVIREVEKELPEHAPHVISYRGDSTYLDTVAANRLQLERAGLTNIDASEIDVFARPDEFFSYRRDGDTGRNGVFVSL